MQSGGTPFCLLDKDTLYGGYSAAAMAMLTGDPNDRDSPLFLEHLRDPGIPRPDRHRPRQSRTRRERARGRAAFARSARAATVRSRVARREGRSSVAGRMGLHVGRDARISGSWSARIRTMPTNSRIGTSTGSAASRPAANLRRPADVRQHCACFGGLRQRCSHALSASRGGRRHAAGAGLACTARHKKRRPGARGV